MNTTNKQLIFFTLSFLFFKNSYGQQWPAITRQAKPWARWWWQGSAVNKPDLAFNLAKYKDAGLGGLEITPIYGVRGQEKNFIIYLSPQWVDMLNFTIKQAGKLGMGIDMANATGWPFGGPWVDDEHAAKNMVMKKYTLNGGERLKENIIYMQQPLVSAEGKALLVNEVLQPVAANKNLQQMALDQVRFKKLLPLQVLMAYDNAGNILNLTEKVEVPSGLLNWIAPPGNWTLYAIFMGSHGKMVERAAPGGEGLVIDHYSKPALKAYLDYFDKVFSVSPVSGIRAFFNDSYEVDDASGQANFTPELFREFRNRRGYSLEEHLPEFFDKENKNYSRIVCDFRETVSDMLLANFTIPWRNWANSKGAIIRNQSHGSPANILDLYSAVDIPETEGTDPLSFRFAVSAAHVSGKKLVSSESATWLNDHFLSSLSDVKKAIDQYLAGGVNHVFFHGISYSPPAAPWPGWLFYAAVHLVPANPMWKDFHALNEYIARSQSFLQQGDSDDDVLLYYPLFDSFAEPGKTLLKHYNFMKNDFNGTDFQACAKLMLNKGYAFDYISDKQVLGLSYVKQKIKAQKATYQTLMLPNCRYIPLPTFNKLVRLAAEGAHILIYKNLPEDVPGLSNLDSRREQLMKLLKSLNFIEVVPGVEKAAVGKGYFLLADSAEQLLAYTKIRREQMADKGLQYNRRKTSEGNTYFIVNPTGRKITGWFPLSVQPAAVALFDPMTASSGLARIKALGQHTKAVYLQLEEGQSCILKTSSGKLSGRPYSYYKAAGEPIEIKGDWNVDFITGGPELPASSKQKQLQSWTDFGGEQVKNFSGTARYTVTFPKPVGNAYSYLLNLGSVCHSAEVFLNQVRIATLIGPRYTVVLRGSDFKKVNKLEVNVSNLMANRIADMDRRNIPYRVFYNVNFPASNKLNRGSDGLFNASQWQPLPSGLIGPVVLQKLDKIKFN